MIQVAGAARQWQVVTKDSSQTIPPVDAAILTLPAPQLLQLQGEIKDLMSSSGIGKKLTAVTYSARFALALWFSPEKAAAVTACVPGAGMYVNRDSGLDVRFIAHDTAKRGVSVPHEEAGVSLVVHSSVTFGQVHVDADKEVGGEVLLQQVQGLLPSLPKPDEVKHHKWRYSQVTKPFEFDSAAAAGAVVLCADPLLILAGDSFTESNLDGCIRSAEAAVAAIDRSGLLTQ
jgi:renalase